ncbi:hypothetical protein GCM10027590_13140 [Nocardiopsis nanhaiensis]
MKMNAQFTRVTRGVEYRCSGSSPCGLLRVIFPGWRVFDPCRAIRECAGRAGDPGYFSRGAETIARAVFRAHPVTSGAYAA